MKAFYYKIQEFLIWKVIFASPKTVEKKGVNEIDR